ncbi:MAG: hypothetical protein ACE366_08620 [Bradymonadia bacterium]
MRRALTSWTLLGLMICSHQAGAEDNDPSLYRFQDADGRPDQAAFKEYALELGSTLSPKLLAPAETLGINGFQFATQLSITNINDSEDYWQLGVEDSSPPTTLMASHLIIRKGLPFSFEVGGSATYLINSELWAFGAEGKWALNEAIDDAPVDFAVRAAYSRMVGSIQMNLSSFNMDFVLSKSFGVAGVVNIAPYMAYSPLWVFASSEVLDPTPAIADDPQQNFVLSQEEPFLNRFVFGMRFIFANVNFTPEASFAQGIQTYSFNLGLDY